MAARVDFSTRDPERAVPVLEEFFSGLRMSSPREGFALEIVGAEVDPFAVVHYRLRSPSSTSSVDMTETLSFGQISTGSVDLSSRRQGIDTDQPWMFPQGRVQGNWDDVTITALTLSPSAALQRARAIAGSDTVPLKFLGTSPLDQSHGRQWVAFVDYLRGALIEDSPLIESPLVRANAFAHLVSMMLETFPNTIMDLVSDESRPLAMPGTVRRALAFIDDNAQSPITIDDVARDARLSVRGLQYAFRRNLDTTPAQYLRRARLAGAHRELQGADPTSGITVLRIATRWGFVHPGRFAQQYRAAYGVLPRQTLDD